LIPNRPADVLELTASSAAAQASNQATRVFRKLGLAYLTAAQRAGFLLGFYPIAEQRLLIFCQQLGNDC
jgi:hypothetical protein